MLNYLFPKLVVAIILFISSASQIVAQDEYYRIIYDNKGHVYKSEGDLKNAIMNRLAKYDESIREKEKVAKDQKNPFVRNALKRAEELMREKKELANGVYELTSFSPPNIDSPIIACSRCSGTGIDPGWWDEFWNNRCKKCRGVKIYYVVGLVSK